ncbi:MAG: hypothetical protein IKU25_01865 [Clostridia bacterium]|nr:hypothetical protein [Clostridia bacterium]
MKKNNVRNTAWDLIYTILGTVVLTGVLQLIVYPLINHFYGSAVTDEILYFIGIIYIVPTALGGALGNIRLMMRKECDVTNRDFVPFAAILSAICALVCGFVAFYDSDGFIFPIAFAVFSVLYLLRMYVVAEFRLDLKFKGYSLYFVAISVGYLVGFGLYLLTDIWLLIFTVGEVAALLYSFIWGKMFRNDGLSGNRAKITKPLVMLAFSSVVRDCVNQFDKVILKQVAFEGMVTEYHVISLISKTIMMLVQPINTLILSYLTVKDSGLTKKQLIKFTGIALACGGVFYVGCIIGTPIFIKLAYPDLYDTVIQYNLIVNLGVIIGFISTMFMSILLTQGKAAIQMAIQTIWGVGYIVAAYYFTTKYQIWGLAYVTLIANVIKLLLAIAFTFMEKKVKN